MLSSQKAIGGNIVLKFLLVGADLSSYEIDKLTSIK